MTTENEPPDSDEYDSPWKDVLESYFPDFMRFFFPRAAADIDWSKGYLFLDKELQQVTRDAEIGRRLADKLAQVWRKDGEDAWVLAHVEVQGQAEKAFPKRIFVYNYRIFDRYDRPVASLAVLADERKGWRPDSFGYELWGSQMELRFPIAKISDFADDWAGLEASDNPFATVVMVHLKTQQTRHAPEARKYWKFKLIRNLYERGWERTDILCLFRFMDWLMRLPRELELRFLEELRQYEEEKRMPYVTSVEKIGFDKGLQVGEEKGIRIGEERGLRNGLLESIEMGLSIRFGKSGMALWERINNFKEIATLKRIKEAVKTTDQLSDIEKLVADIESKAQS